MYQSRVAYVGESPAAFREIAKGKLSLVEIQGRVWVWDTKAGSIYRATDGQYIHLEDIYGRENLQPVCIKCGESARVRNRLSPQGMESVHLLSEAQGKHNHPHGFAHIGPDNDGVECADYTGGHRTFKKFQDDNEFDHLEKLRNLAALRDPDILRELRAVTEFYMKIKTNPKAHPSGEAGLPAVLADPWRFSGEHQEKADEAMHKVQAMKGIIEQPWVYAIAGAALSGPYDKLNIMGRKMPVEWDLMGDRWDYAVTQSLDGAARALRIRSQIALCWNDKSARNIVALRRGGRKGNETWFAATAEFCERIVAAKLDIPREEVLITANARAAGFYGLGQPTAQAYRR